jgi:hypothetical protein
MKKSVDRLNGFNLVVGAPGIVGKLVGSYRVAFVLANGILKMFLLLFDKCVAETVLCGA